MTTNYEPDGENFMLQPEPLPTSNKPRALTKAQRTAHFILSRANAFQAMKPSPDGTENSRSGNELFGPLTKKE